MFQTEAPADRSAPLQQKPVIKAQTAQSHQELEPSLAPSEKAHKPGRLIDWGAWGRLRSSQGSCADLQLAELVLMSAIGSSRRLKPVLAVHLSPLLERSLSNVLLGFGSASS